MNERAYKLGYADAREYRPSLYPHFKADAASRTIAEHYKRGYEEGRDIDVKMKLANLQQEEQSQ